MNYSLRAGRSAILVIVVLAAASLVGACFSPSVAPQGGPDAAYDVAADDVATEDAADASFGPEAAGPDSTVHEASADASPDVGAEGDAPADGDATVGDVALETSIDASTDGLSDVALEAADGAVADAADSGPACTPGALSFDGIDDFADITGTAALNLTTAMTVEVWAKTTATIGPAAILASKHTCGSIAGWWVALDSNNGPNADVAAYYVDNPNLSNLLLSPTALNDGVWHHIVATWDGTTASLYVDGALQGSQTIGYTATSGSDWVIGAATFGTCAFYTGLIDEVSIWSVARSASEVAQDFAHPLVGSETGLEGYWNFDDVACGVQAADHSGHGRNAQLGGSSTPGPKDPLWVADGPFLTGHADAGPADAGGG